MTLADALSDYDLKDHLLVCEAKIQWMEEYVENMKQTLIKEIQLVDGRLGFAIDHFNERFEDENKIEKEPHKCQECDGEGVIWAEVT